jgi:class 3 adenylate cyclase
LLLVVLRHVQRRPMVGRELLRAVEAPRSEVLVALDALQAEGLLERREAGSYGVTRQGVEALLARAGEASRVSGPATILFTDIVGSTELLDRLGDAAAHELVRRHFSLLRGVVADHGGQEVKSLGDGLMVAFADARAALDCGRAMQLAVAGSADRLELRVGIAAGEAARENDDYFGRPVVVARRLCDAAGAGEVLVAEGLAGASPAHQLERVAPLRLKGFSTPVAAAAMRVRPHAVAA